MTYCIYFFLKDWVDVFDVLELKTQNQPSNHICFFPFTFTSYCTDLQWLPHSRLQYSLSQSWPWGTPGPGPGPGAPGDWEPPMLFWYSDCKWEKLCRKWKEKGHCCGCWATGEITPKNHHRGLPAAREAGSEERPAAPSGEGWLAGTGPAAFQLVGWGASSDAGRAAGEGGAAGWSGRRKGERH